MDVPEFSGQTTPQASPAPLLDEEGKILFYLPFFSTSRSFLPPLFSTPALFYPRPPLFFSPVLFYPPLTSPTMTTSSFAPSAALRSRVFRWFTKTLLWRRVGG